MRLIGHDPECPPLGAYAGLCHICKRWHVPDHDELDGGEEGRDAGQIPQEGGVRCCSLCRHYFCDRCRGRAAARALAAAAHLVWPKDDCCGPRAQRRR